MSRVPFATSFVTKVTRGRFHGDLRVPDRFKDLGLADEACLFFGTRHPAKSRCKFFRLPS
ncbi:MAG: hypothetical protein C0427_17495 [Rhodobacter sp.]|nr:hypothetical protein [Rhodobacter sp.]